jgi:hypothetical protein
MKQEKILTNLYYKNFDGADKLYIKAKKVDPTIERKDVLEFLKNQSLHQITTKAVNKPQKYLPVFSNTVNNFQMDMMFLTQYKTQNFGYHIVLICIDISTRYLFVYLLKNKDIDSILDAMNMFADDVYNKTGEHIRKLAFDEESSFLSKRFSAFVDEEQITIDVNNSKKHRLSIVDRAIKSMRDKLNKFFVLNQSFVWFHKDPKLNIITQLTKNYNKTEHKAFGNEFSPKEVMSNPILQNYFRQNKIDEYEEILDSKESKDNLQIGDTVRVQINKNTFEKSVPIKFTTRVYVIEKVNTNTVKLKDYEKLIDKKHLKKVIGNEDDEDYTKIENMYSENKKSSKLAKELAKLV